MADVVPPAREWRCLESMRPVLRTSIGRKLTLVIMFTSGVVLFLALACFVGYELITFRQAMVRDLTVLAQMSAENNAAALAFDDPNAATENLAALTAKPSILAACIYTRARTLFAAHLREGVSSACPPSPPTTPGYQVLKGRMVLSQTISLAGDALGTIYVDAETHALRDRMNRYAGIAAVILLIGTAVALLLSTRLQRVISDPIVELTQTATLVAVKKDYSVRVARRSDDEIGVLTDAFNEMLERIQQHAGALDAEVVMRRRIEEELRKALAKEKELAELKSHFVSMASHEFRTPLTTILAASDSLKRYGPRMTPTQQIERVDKIQAQVRHMTDLLEDVLVIGREESGKLRCVPEQLDIQALCNQLVQEVQATAAATHRLVLSGTFSRRDVMMDPKLLRQILGNLLTNAVKYSPAGGTVEIDVTADARVARFAVRDHGIGIAPEDRDRLFEPFHRGANVGAIAGSGLGLAITKKAVELHGGAIAVDSMPGQGTKFVVTLPTDGRVPV
jgi:signal transduction histidine kinase